jgi:Flagellar basal-body P-ring protein
LRLLLKRPDFTTAQAIARAINQKFPESAVTLDAGTVEVAIPPEKRGNVVGFAGEIGLLEVAPDAVAVVVINERTGTVVAGQHVKISTVAVAHGNLTIVTAENPEVSQPLPFSRGQTTVVPRTQLNVTEQGGGLAVVEQSVTVAELARALNALGVTPRDLIAIFQALKDAGALHAELIIE